MENQNKDNTVNVLLSTYNGEKHLEELLDSVLSQEEVNVNLIIRDDGSSDNTISIIQNYMNVYQNISFFLGENLGPGLSFLTLLQMAPPAEYYAYCDQDDVWQSDKLIRAIKFLRKTKGEPSLYMSTYNVTDENLNILFKQDMHYEKTITLENVILFRSPSGCTMVFNLELAKVIGKKLPRKVRMHDFWTLLSAIVVGGNVYTEDYPSLLYRQHSGNTVGIVPTFHTRVKRLVNSVLKNPNERSGQARDLLEIYGENIVPSKKAILEEVCEYRSSIANRLKFISNKNYRWDPYINLLFRISVLTGLF